MTVSEEMCVCSIVNVSAIVSCTVIAMLIEVVMEENAKPNFLFYCLPFFMSFDFLFITSLYRNYSAMPIVGRDSLRAVVSV